MTANFYDEMKTTTTHSPGSDIYMYIAIHGFKLLCDNISWNSCIVLIYIIYTNNSTIHVLQNIYM